MTVVCVHARSHVPILALVQFSSAGFFEKKKKIITPVITVWGRFSVAESHKCHNPPSQSLQPISCFSTESLVVNELRDWACDYTWEFARETFQSTKKHYSCSSSSAACPSHLCSLSPSPHHLSVSHHAKKRMQTDSLNLPTGRLCPGCVLLLVCWEGRESIRKEGKTEIINSATCLAQGVDKGDILHTNAAPFCPSL